MPRIREENFTKWDLLSYHRLGRKSFCRGFFRIYTCHLPKHQALCEFLRLMEVKEDMRRVFQRYFCGKSVEPNCALPSSHNSLLELLELFIPCNSVLAPPTEKLLRPFSGTLNLNGVKTPNAIKSTFIFVQISSTYLCNMYLPTTCLATPARLTCLAVCMHASHLLHLVFDFIDMYSCTTYLMVFLTYAYLHMLNDNQEKHMFCTGLTINLLTFTFHLHPVLLSGGKFPA